MRKHRNTGFTLVEILIVVVILGILAAIVVPQFTNASNEAVKGAIQSQLQTINSQVELFRVRNNGNYDFNVDPGDGTVESDGWWQLVGDEYLKESPVNGYTGSAVLVEGSQGDSEGQDRDSANGWYWDDDDNESSYTVYASAYDQELDLLAHEDGFGG